jgi:hypothetical protein
LSGFSGFGIHFPCEENTNDREEIHFPCLEKQKPGIMGVFELDLPLEPRKIRSK